MRKLSSRFSLIDCIREAGNGWGCRPIVVCTFSMHKSLGSVTSIEVYIDGDEDRDENIGEDEDRGKK